MAISKEERYAMIRKAALKIQKRGKIARANDALAKEVEILDRQDYKSNISWSDTDRFIEGHFSDLVTTNSEEWN